jgi:hypothetical protein
MEPGAWPSSTIPNTTLTVPVVRNADQVSWTNPLNPGNPAAWTMSATVQPKGPWPYLSSQVSGAALCLLSADRWSVFSGTFVALAGSGAEEDTLEFSTTDNFGGSRQVQIRRFLPQTYVSSPTELAGPAVDLAVLDNAGVMSTVPAGNAPIGPGTGVPHFQGASIRLGQDGFGTGPFSGWMRNLSVGTGIPAGPASQLVFPGDATRLYAPGDLFQYVAGGAAYLARVTGVTWDVGSNTTTVTLDRAVPWNGGDTFTVYKGIQTRLELLPLGAGDPLYEKQWQNVYLYLTRATFDSAALSYATEKQQTPVAYPLAGPAKAPWDYDDPLGFGLTAWGGTGRNVILKLALDQAAARSGALTLSFSAGDALTSWELSALRIPYVVTTSRTVR